MVTDKKKKDAEGKEMEEKGDPKELKADRKDSRYDAYVDAYDSDEVRNAISDIQAKAETIFSAFGDSAPRPMMNETANQYLRRNAMKLRSHSKDWTARVEP